MKRSTPVLTPAWASGNSGAWDDYYVYCPTVIQEDSKFWMWYSAASLNKTRGNSGDKYERIGYATSPDGVTWTKSPDNPILDTGPPGSWDATKYINYQGVVPVNGTVYLYYGGISSLGLARPPTGFAIPELQGRSALAVLGLLLATTIVFTNRFRRKNHHFGRST